MILVILENNWDLTLRESMIGRFIFAATLGSVLLRLSWFAFYSDEVFLQYNPYFTFQCWAFLV